MASEASDRAPNNDEWIQHLIGHDWEIFWEPQSAEPSPEKRPDTSESASFNDSSPGKVASNDSSDEDSVEHDPDWYEARVESLLRNDEAGPVFFVSFVGEDTKYEMTLSPAIVRPSAQAWISRARAIIDTNQSSFEEWKQALPRDTARLEDGPVLKDIKDNCLATSESPVGDLLSILRSQLYLRTKVFPFQSVEDGDILTQKYIDYLVECLNDLERCCLWYIQCRKLLDRVGQDQETRINPSYVTEVLEGGRRTIITLITMDTSEAASKRKRKQPTPSPSSTPTPTLRRTKRRKIRKGFSDFWQETSSGGKAFNEEIDEEDFQSTEMVKSLVNRFHASDVRWFARLFGAMLKRFSSQLVSPLTNWQKRAHFYLGDTDTLDIEPSDGETSGEESDGEADFADDRSKASQGSDDSGGKYLKYEDIESAVDSATCGAILKHFDLSGLLERLLQKLSAIDSFSRRAWDRISHVLDENTAVSTDHDQIYQDLKHLIEMARNKDSPVSNVEPMGRQPSQLTRETLRNALAYRKWFVDLKHAESVREQAAFVRELVSSYRELPRPEPCPELAMEISKLSPRVEALAQKAKVIDEDFTLSQYKAKLCDRSSTDELTPLDMSEALAQLSTAPAISVVEEMLAVRRDITTWNAEAASVLSRDGAPSFDEVILLKQQADSILEGKSATRTALLRLVRGAPEVDSEIRAFAKLDMTTLCGPQLTETERLFLGATSWKERADSIVTALRSHENPLAGEPLPPTKLSVMVDLKRIRELIVEYDSMGVDLKNLYKIMLDVQTAAKKWSCSVSNYILEPNRSFDECLDFIKTAGRERPKGIIVEPTRHVVDALDELLTWYLNVRRSVESGEFADRVETLIAEGLDILEQFGQKHNVSFTWDSTVALQLLAKRAAWRQQPRTINVAKLGANDLCLSVLNRMIDVHIDSSTGRPLLTMVELVWRCFVAEYVSRCHSPNGNRDDLTLIRGKALLSQKPLLVSNSISFCIREVQQLQLFVDEATKKEAEARQLLSQSKPLLRGVLQNIQGIQVHCMKLRDLVLAFKVLVASGLSPDVSLDKELDSDFKVFQWLVRASQHPVLITRVVDEQGELTSKDKSNASNTRIPWDALVTLYERSPKSTPETGDFAYIVLRVKELYDEANSWQEEISGLTYLSLKGGKRRVTKSDDDGQTLDKEVSQTQTRLEVEKLEELSHHPILAKVIMPREDAMKNMLANTKAFEAELINFLGKDYEGPGADRTAYPQAWSLVGKDGSFLLYRLTGSPLFDALKTSISSIEKIACDVFADTPGKATFDWIKQATRWIESLSSAVVSISSSTPESHAGTKLVLPCVPARHLYGEGHQILLTVPEDLRRTLSQHGVIVTTSKEGKLTVKCKKGGAHHALGVTAIRWCPVLFDSLKADCSKLDDWEKDLREIRSSFKSYIDSTVLAGDESMFRWYEFREIVADLIATVSQLVVYPDTHTLECAMQFLNDLDGGLAGCYANPQLMQTFASRRIKDPSAIVRHRNDLLDALVHRVSLENEQSRTPPEISAKDSQFRVAGRVLIEKALRDAMRSMNISISNEAQAFTAMLAWLIEKELFNLYQTELGDGKISPEYRAKARCLKRSLEDHSNLALAARVLASDISPAAFVKMSPEELANPRTKEDRAKAQAAATQHSNLTRDLHKDIVKNRHPQIEPDKKPAAKATTVQRVAPPPKEPLTESPPAAKETKTPRSSFSLGDIVKKSQRPPPPPSLAASLQVDVSRTAPSDVMIKSATGSDRFQISIANFGFMAGFYAEGDPESELDGTLPDSMRDKGRLKIDEFTNFVSSKLDSRNWHVVKLRLITLSDRDTWAYKAFCRDYESRARIAMFVLEDDAKLFLVTPKFHHAAPNLDFSKPASTYAVVLVRTID